MQLDVQWFVATLMANELISADDAKMLNQALGGEPDLMTYAQEFLARMTEGLSEEERELEEPVILEYVIDGEGDYLEEIVDEDEYDEIYGIYFGEEGYEA